MALFDFILPLFTKNCIKNCIKNFVLPVDFSVQLLVSFRCHPVYDADKFLMWYLHQRGLKSWKERPLGFPGSCFLIYMSRKYVERCGKPCLFVGGFRFHLRYVSIFYIHCYIEVCFRFLWRTRTLFFCCFFCKRVYPLSGQVFWRCLTGVERSVL